MAATGPPATRTGRPRKASTAASHAGPSNTAAETPTTASTPAPGTTGGGPSIAPGTTMHSFVPSNGPQTVLDCETFAAQLLDPSVPPRRKQELAVELRDSAENSKDFAYYAKYLEVLIPAVVTLLGEEKTISFLKDNADQRLRNSLLTYIQRLPKTEPFKIHEVAVMELSVKLLRVENEENALVCIKIMIDAFRNHRDQAEPFVQPFLDCVKTMYANLRGVIEKEFAIIPGKSSAPPPSAGLANSASNAPTPNSAITEGSQPPPTANAPPPPGPPPMLARALYSPKVLTECPIAVVLVFQTYKSIMAVVMDDFYPLVMQMIQIQPEPQRVAYEEAKEKGQTFIGIAPGIVNREMFAELVKAQVKTMAFLAYVLRGHSPSASKDYIDVFPEACVRLLRNCPPEDVGTRKELLVATRHILSSDSRAPFIPFISMLLDERVLVGTGITSRETLRPLAYSVVADLIHHVRSELPLAQLARVIHVMSLNLNDATFNGAIQTMCAKLLNTMVEAVHSKAEPAESHRMMRSMFFTSLEKLRSLTESFERLKAITARDKAKAKAKGGVKDEPPKSEAVVGEDVEMGDEENEEKIKEREREQEERLLYGWREIEQAMPVHAVAYASDSIEAFCKEARFLFKTLLHTFRTLLNYTKLAVDPLPAPDGEVLGQFFEYALRSLAIFEGVRDPREQKEAVELLSQILLQFQPHVFSSVWTINMDQFVRNASTSPHFFPVLQNLITNQDVSHQLVGILLKYLMNHIHELGGYTPHQTGLALKLFKMSFLAINTYIGINESVLVPHLQKLILRCFECAAQAEDSAIYYQILRALFRSIGGGRFEALYKEVLPILQEMLDTLSHLLQHATDDTERDLFVELTLTVPVRLTNLLPHLSYLMKPLVHALRAGPESVSQGLRTLELCIDNLTADFLDPTMGPILRELMAALHRLLKPVPANRLHSSSAIRILGKLGGRNRRFQEVDNLLDYTTAGSDIPIPIYIEGKGHQLLLGPIVSTASTALELASPEQAEDSIKVLMIAVMSVLQPDGPNSEGNETFTKAMSGLFTACQHPTLSVKATEFVRDFCRRVFAAEVLRKDTKTDVDRIVAEMARKRYLSLTSAVADCFVDTLAKSRPSERDGLCDFLAVIMADFRALTPGSDFKNADPAKIIDRGLQTFVHRFCTLCHEEDWNRKLAGVAAIRTVVKNVEVNRSLLYDLEVDLVRALLFCLRDAPLQVPKSAKSVIDLIQEILRHCRANEKNPSRVAKLVETLVIELNSQSLSSRQCAQRSLSTLAEMTDKTLHALIADPARTKLLDPSAGPIFSKPLRALPFAMQVANIDAVTYLIEVQPPLIDTSEEFVRLSHEVIALADVSDDGLIQKPATQKQEYWIKSLRVACLRLLRAAMSLPNFTTQAHLLPTRSRIVQVYFKHVYSQQPEIVEVAHEGLRDSLQQQHKLPKDLLQAGLRPILVNLADAKRLSVSGLDGLARFLELLTSYFKLEIGVKLLEHFQALGDPASLASASSAPLEDNSDIARMSRLVNVFRLLPDGADEYLVRLTNYVVNAESLLHQFVPGPLTSSMAAYFNKYSAQGAQNLFDNVSNPRFVWTYRNIIASGEAPNLVEELSNRIDSFCNLTLTNSEAVDLILPGLHIIGELSKTKESWFSEHEVILEFLVSVWRTILTKSRTNHPDMMTLPYQQIPSMILDLFMRFLKTQKHVALLFHLVEAFEVKSAFERSNVAFFLYQQAALQDSTEYRREVLEHFFNLYEEEIVTWEFKANGLRLVVNPLLRMYASTEHDSSLLPDAFTAKLAALVWRPLCDTRFAKQRDDDLLIEIFALTILIVEHFSTKVADTRKDVFKLAWMGVNLLEPTVKLMAYILAARFMATYDTPWKFVKLTWTGLLRLKDNENRTLYRQAIDTLAKCLHKQPTDGPEKRGDGPMYPAHAIPEWAQRVRSVLIEEGHATSQLVTVCELLVNHPDQFYEYRELYVPHVANSLSRLAFVQTTTPDLKKLTVDIVELIFRWERRRMAARDEAMEVDEAGSKRREEGAESPLKRQRIYRAGTAVSTSSGGGWAAPTHVREMMTAHLLRLVSSSTEPVSRGGLTKRALELFKEILGPKGLVVHVKMSFFNRTMKADITDSSINVVANSTETIAVVAAAKAPREPQWIKQNLGVLTSLLEKVWVFDEPALHATVEDVTDMMFTEMADEENLAEADKDAKDLYTFVSTAVNDGLTASLRSSSSLPGTLFLLRAWLKVHPKQIQNENIASGLLKVLQNLAKVHTTNSSAPDQAHRLIISILDVLRGRVADLRELRRTLNGVILTLIEKSTNLHLCRYLLDVMKQWVLDDPEPASMGKEKAALLMRMAIFEQRDETLFQQYLDLIFDIYERVDLRGTDLTHRLEPAFLLGTRSQSQPQRIKFLDKLEQSLPRNLDQRLQYLYSLQNWDTLSESYWIPQILSMLLAVVNPKEAVIRRPLSQVREDDPLIALAANQMASEILIPTRNLIHIDTELARQLWVAIFPKCWSSLNRNQQTSFTPYIIKLLAKEYHKKQVELRPNVIQTFLEGILPCFPVVTLPPFLVKYLAKSFDAWYIGFEFLHKLSDVYRGDDELRETCAKSLSELYAELCEDDMFYGLARSRCVFPETTAGLTYEQNGLWPQAIEMYEAAQIKARGGLLPFSEDEYCLWEDHWVLAAQKLQNWDSLTELARTDQDSDLLLECAWRISDWGSSDRETIETNINRVIDIPTPRRKTFEAYTALLKAHSAREPPNDFVRILDEAQQVTLRKWISLPSHTTAAHLPLLQMFQQCVELHEASQVFDSLQNTNQANLEMRATTDLKPIFTTWRERLPNFWDDISVWSDLLAWRQHVFQAVTKVYVPLIPPGETATYGFRGYHETAWTINRFGEMARRHNLLDVCSTALNKIYSLPNIEISEAFLKLREQALCFFQKPEKFNEGLENISTTNLMYFTPAQKAEFLTLKGVFIAQLGQHDEANAEFAHAIQMDMNLPKAWAEWGKFNDKLYNIRPEIAPEAIPESEPGAPKMTREEWQVRYSRDRAVYASSAVSCYLQAAGLYSNHKARALLLRILWLLGLDDSQSTIAKAFENYKGDLILWYWITLIPQLLLSLSHREAKQARLLLLRIAKMYPQALFYQLRVTKEDFGIVKRQQAHSRMQAQRKAADLAKAAAANLAASAPAKPAAGEDVVMADGDKPETEAKDESQPSQTLVVPSSQPAPAADDPSQAQAASGAAPASNAPRQPWELVDEIMNNMKSSFPLLTLTMEKMVDQITIRAKPASDEDIYRFFAALLADALQQWGQRALSAGDDGELSPATKDNLIKFSSNLSGEMRNAIEKDFMRDTPKLREYIRRLQHWRDSYERGLDARPQYQPLDQGGCNLIDFHHAKFDDVEVPGQYVHHVDHADEFVKIARFAPRHEVARGHGHCFRRITMIGHDTSIHTFSVQMPAARHCRREERLTQLFRILNSVLRKRKEARRRNIQFHLPAAIAMAPQLRLVENDSSYVTLQDVYDEYSRSKSRTREASIMTFYDRVKQLSDGPVIKNDQRQLQVKMEVLEEIQAKMVPDTILTNYMIRSMRTPEAMWLMRKQFSLQMAGTAFLTYLCCLHNRAPNRFHFSRRTGLMYMTEILPGFAQGQPLITSSESCPFRLTPNIQTMMGRAGVEGTMTAAVTAISQSLLSPGFDLAGSLSLFVRDELLTWQATYMKDAKTDSLNKSVHLNVENFVRRVATLGYIGPNADKAPNASPVVHAIVTLISQASAPIHLASMPESWMPWF